MIITNHNYGRYLYDAVNSVMAQTYPASDVVIVDDGSTDESERVLRELMSEFGDRLRVIWQRNAGQASAINTGLRYVNGSIVAMLDADDWWEPFKLEHVIRVFNSKPEVGFVQHRLRKIDSAGMTIPGKRTYKIPSGNLLRLLRLTGGANVFEPTSGLAFRRSVLDRIAPLPELEWRLCADGAMAFAAATVTHVESLPESLGFYRIHSSNGFVTNRRSLDSTLAGFRKAIDYTNQCIRRSGLGAEISLHDQLDYRRLKYYSGDRSLSDFFDILSIIFRWPLYNWRDKVWYGLRFLIRASTRPTNYVRSFF